MRALVAAVLLASGCAHRTPAPVGAKDSWLVAVNTGGWVDTFGQDAGGLGTQLLVARAVRSHVLAGARFTGLTAIDLNDPPSENVPHLGDLGPFIGTGASWSRLAVSASAGPMLTHVEHDDDGWASSWTLGLGLDGAVTVRATSFVGIGLHVIENVNPMESATGFALRLDVSLR